MALIVVEERYRPVSGNRLGSNGTGVPQSLGVLDFFGKDVAPLPIAEQVRKLLRRDGFAVQKSLRLVAPELPKRIELVLRLHTLGHHRHSEGACNFDDDRDECFGSRIGGQLANEAAVDLQGVYGEVRQTAEGGVAGAEVIDGDMHPRST